MAGLAALFSSAGYANAASASSGFFSTGQSAIDGKIGEGGALFIKVVRMIIFVLAILAVIKFVKDKEWINLLYAGGGIVLIVFLPKVLTALETWAR
jgi:hypothetical protein